MNLLTLSLSTLFSVPSSPSWAHGGMETDATISDETDKRIGLNCFVYYFSMTFRLRDLALTSCSADINARSIRWNSSSILHGVGRSIIKGKSADYLYKNSSFWLKYACLYHFFAATQKDFALFLYLCTR